MDTYYKTCAVVLLLLQLLLFRVSRSQHSNVQLPIKTEDVNGYQLISNPTVTKSLLRIMKGNDFACGAAYYSPLYVLTAASCMHHYQKYINDLSVEFLSGFYFALIDRIFVPKQYSWPKNYMDIAVVKLVDPLPGKNPQFVQLCKHPLHDYSQLTVVACAEAHQEIRTEQVSIMSQIQCEKHYPKLQLAETIACTKTFIQTKECMYNFGCPITVNNELCGIVASGPECKNTKLPGLFTDIYQVKHFITKVIKDDQSKTKHTKKIWLDK